MTDPIREAAKDLLKHLTEQAACSGCDCTDEEACPYNRLERAITSAEAALRELVADE